MIDFATAWNDGIISFDTCSLGRMYEWDSIYAVNIKDSLSYLLECGKLWESEINIDEFTIQRKAIKDSIYEQKYIRGIFNNLKKRPIPWNKIDGTLGRWEAKGFSQEFRNKINSLRGRKSITDAEYASIETESRLSAYELDFETLINNILVPDGTVLSEKEKEDIIKIYDSGVMCPGAKDSKKNNGNKYNDLFIWKSLQKKAKREQKNIIFVTADTAKGDWFLHGKPRIEYIQEFTQETGHEIVIVSLTEFWEEAKAYLETSVEEFIEISSIKSQIDEKYNVFYQEEVCDKIENLLFESDEIKYILEDIVDCCVDMPVLNELIETTIEDIYIVKYDEDYVWVNIVLRTEADFEAQNHCDGEDWSAGNGSVLLDYEALARIPKAWTSDDTSRFVLEDKIDVIEITNIEVIE